MTQVLYFWAEWCGPCKTIKPMMQQLQSQMSISFIEVSTVIPESCKTWDVQSVPTVIVIKNAIEKGRLVGTSISKNAVINLYNK